MLGNRKFARASWGLACGAAVAGLGIWVVERLSTTPNSSRIFRTCCLTVNVEFVVELRGVSGSSEFVEVCVAVVSWRAGWG